MLYSFRNWIQLFLSNFPPLRSQALNRHAKSLLFSPINCCKCITFAASAPVNFTSNTTSHKAGESLSWIAFNRCPNASRHWTMDGISKVEGAWKVALSVFASLDSPAQMRRKIKEGLKITPLTLCRHRTTLRLVIQAFSVGWAENFHGCFVARCHFTPEMYGAAELLGKQKWHMRKVNGELSPLTRGTMKNAS